MRLLQINDVHLSDQAPRMRTASYLDDVLAKLAACMERAQHEGVDVVVITGDLWHRKNAAHTTHRTVQRVREILNGPMIPVRIVPGNHDEAHGGGLDGQPLLSVLGDNVRLLVGDDPDWPICGVPWDNRMEREGGAGYIAEQINACTAPLVFAHAPLTLRPYPFGPEASGWVEVAALEPLLRDDVLLVAHGHMHNWHVRYRGPDGIEWSNPGALARATIGADDIDREPMAALIEYEYGAATSPSVQYVVVPHRPAAEVYRVAQHEAEVERGAGITALAGALAGASTHVATPEVLQQVLAGLVRPDGVPEAVWGAGLEVAQRAIEDASA